MGYGFTGRKSQVQQGICNPSQVIKMDFGAPIFKHRTFVYGAC